MIRRCSGPGCWSRRSRPKAATTRAVYLPEGRWYASDTGQAYDGPATITLTNLSLASLPMFVREGAIVPRGPVMPWTDAAAIDPLTLEVWPGAGATTFTVYEDSGDGYDYEDSGYAATTWTLQGSSTGATLSSQRVGTHAIADRSVRVHVRPVDVGPTAVRLDGAAVADVGSWAALETATAGWWWDETDRSLWVVVPDAGWCPWGSSLNDRCDCQPRPGVSPPTRADHPGGGQGARW